MGICIAFFVFPPIVIGLVIGITTLYWWWQGHYAKWYVVYADKGTSRILSYYDARTHLWIFNDALYMEQADGIGSGRRIKKEKSHGWTY